MYMGFLERMEGGGGGGGIKYGKKKWSGEKKW